MNHNPLAPSNPTVWLWCFLLLLSQTAWSGVLQAAQTDPFLRLNIGTHSAKIRSLSSDASGHWVLTTSDDKTAKLWNARSGQLLRTFRIPIGFGNEGKIFAGAISPDGQRVALGGWTSLTDEDDALGRDGFSIYVFDRDNGQLLNRIPRQANVIQALIYSRDGTYLAAAQGGDGGISIFRKDGTLLASDRKYVTSTFGLDFDESLRLVSSSRDGIVRLYQVSDKGLELLSRTSLKDGKEPDQVKFSPNGEFLAVGFNDVPKVTVLESKKLAVLRPLSYEGAQGNLRIVAWSPNGDYLYAGGSQGLDKAVAVHRWNLSVPADYISVHVGNDSVTGLATSGTELLYTTSNSLGRTDQAGRKIYTFTNEGADFRGQGTSFSTSADGTVVSFKFQPEDPATYSFSLAQGAVSLLDSHAQLPQSAAPIPDLQHALKKVDDLEPYEVPRAAHFQTDRRKFVLGTDFRLRMYNARGNLLWSVPSPDSTWVARFSENARWVLAAFGDGTIRWYDASTGKERMAFFAASDRKRWIIWTPEGQYYSAPGAEDLIGWHINNGRKLLPDFFPAARFRSVFFKTELIGASLETADTKSRITQSVMAYLPPVVRIKTPSDQTETSNKSIRISYEISATVDAPVSAMKFRVNGLQVRPLKLEKIGVDWEALIDLPEGENTIGVFAENRHGISTPATLKVTRLPGIDGASSPSPPYRPKLYVLSIGISTYRDSTMNLAFASKDADDFAKVMVQQKGKLYENVKIRLIKDHKATRDEIAAGLDWLKSEVTSKDVGMVFMAGHGLNDANGRFFFLPHNANMTQLISTAISNDDIRDALGSLAGKSFLFIDSCHSGNAFGTARLRNTPTDSAAFINELASAENGVVVFSAATGRQVSLEDKKWGNGAFTKALVEGLLGGADFTKTNKITHKGLDFYIAERVKELTRGQQTPVSISPEGMQDFPIALATM